MSALLFPSMHRSRFAILALVLAVSACGGGGDGGGSTTPPPPTVSSIALARDTATLNIGQTITLSASPKSSTGGAVSAAVTWASTNSSVATIDAGSGLVTAIAPGVAFMVASAGGVTARAQVTVLAPISIIDVTGPASGMGIGGTLQLSAVARDALGGIRTDKAFTWSSSDQNVATVSAAGLVTGKALGTAVISATVDNVTGKMTVAVTSAKPPTITGVTPSTLTPGATATISGTDFDPVASGNVVSIGGITTTVTAATPTQLSVRVASTYPCQATQNVPVSITTFGGTAAGQASLRVATAQAVTAGTLLTVADPLQFGCMELSGSGSRYLVAVVNASQTPSAQIGNIAVKGFTVGGAAIASVSASRTGTSTAGSTSVTGPTVVNAQRLASLRTLQQNANFLHRAKRHFGGVKRVLHNGALRRASLLRTAARGTISGIAGSGTTMASSTAPLPTRIPTTVGDTTTVRIRAADCSTYTNVVARAVYVGPRSVVLEDTKAALAGTMDADYQKLGAEFDQVMFPIIRKNFGDPLALDSVTNNDGRIAMLFSPVVNAKDASLLGFVSACDFFPPDAAPWIGASNQAEIFYARTPTNTTGSPADVNSRDGWYRYMRSTLIHETKHIASFAERILRTPDNAPDLILEDSWLEEGTAQVAIELYARTIYGDAATWKGNAGYDGTLRCDWAKNYFTCGSPPILMLDHFAFLQDYVANIDGKSFMSDGNVDSDIYGSGWLFARWAADTYATNESDFFYTLTTDWQRAGIDNIRARTGQTWERMLTNFMTSVWATGRAGVTPTAGAQYILPSWNLGSIWAGMAVDGRYPTQPLRQQSASLGNFTLGVARVAGGSASFVELTSASPVANQILSVRDGSGGVLPNTTTARVVVLKVQ